MSIFNPKRIKLESIYIVPNVTPLNAAFTAHLYDKRFPLYPRSGVRVCTVHCKSVLIMSTGYVYLNTSNGHELKVEVTK